MNPDTRLNLPSAGVYQGFRGSSISRMTGPKVSDGDFDYVLDDQWWECAGVLPRDAGSVRSTGKTREVVGKAPPTVFAYAADLGVSPRPRRPLRLKPAAVISLGVVAVVTLIVVAVVALMGSSDDVGSVDGSTTAPSPTARSTTATATTEVRPPEPPPPPPPPSASEPVSGGGGQWPRYEPTPSRKPEIGVTRTPVTRSPISVAPSRRSSPNR
ncbi:hypothetical protein MycrhDRAFT_5476 [Mycolicibacterium rhodesiae JS60]|nr:hypothetical protein MycrhDRAFT_5476 [Mycolicibacterium rhodesiae JS60]